MLEISPASTIDKPDPVLQKIEARLDKIDAQFDRIHRTLWRGFWIFEATWITGIAAVVATGS